MNLKLLTCNILLSTLITATSSSLWAQAHKKKSKAVISKPSQKLAALGGTSNYRTPKKQNMQSETTVSGSIEISRATNLYDYKDGSKSDGMSYLIGAAVRTSIGTFSSRVSYEQSLSNDDPDASGVSDSNVTYAMKPYVWTVLSNDYDLALVPSLTMIIPLSKKSVEFDQLQTAVIARVNYGLTHNATTPSATGDFSLNFGLSVGRNFHAYETDKNGTVLNEYSSNQSLGAGYKISDFTLSVSFAHMSRWSYQSSVREGFELTEDLTYTMSPNFSASIGHTNSGSMLKANERDSNVTLIDDDNSIVYLSLGLGF